jgi:AraC-like DNA-binding protein/quercetin dioxygenase-like cupin family protein
MKPVPVTRLFWRDLAPTSAYHAALVSSRFHPGSEVHTHDFCEMVYVVAGRGVHLVNGQKLPLQAGDLIVVRADDCHAITACAGTDLQFVNVAFPPDAWDGFCALAHVPREAWDSPRAVPIPPEYRQECEPAFRDALFSFHEGASALALCRFWSVVSACLVRPHESGVHDEARMPTWLRTACWAMRDQHNLQGGLPRLRELSGVSLAHLLRSLKASCQQTPTEFVNRLRVERAAILLATTTDEIGEIATACGFTALSYFYRRFGERYHLSPRTYRLQAQHAIAPSSPVTSW